MAKFFQASVLNCGYSETWLGRCLCELNYYFQGSKDNPQRVLANTGISGRKEKGFLIAYGLSSAMAALEGLGPATQLAQAQRCMHAEITNNSKDN